MIFILKEIALATASEHSSSETVRTNPVDTSTYSYPATTQQPILTTQPTPPSADAASTLLQDEVTDCDIVQTEMATAVYEKITVVEKFHKEVTYFVKKPGEGGRAKYAGCLSGDLKLTETSQKRTKLSQNEFEKAVNLCNRSYPGLESVMTESETEMQNESRSGGSRQSEKRRRSTRSKPVARKKRQNENTDEESEESEQGRKESPKKRYKSASSLSSMRSSSSIFSMATFSSSEAEIESVDSRFVEKSLL